MFRYWEEKTAWQPEDEIFQKNLKMFVPYKVGDVLTSELCTLVIIIIVISATRAAPLQSNVQKIVSNPGRTLGFPIVLC